VGKQGLRAAAGAKQQRDYIQPTLDWIMFRVSSLAFDGWCYEKFGGGTAAEEFCPDQIEECGAALEVMLQRTGTLQYRKTRSHVVMSFRS